MSISLPSDEFFLLQLIIIPAIVAILSVLICEYGLFGKTKWGKMSDTEKSFSLFMPISFFLYLYFWTYIIQFPIHGVKLISTYFSLAGLVCTIVLLREFLSGKRFNFFFHTMMLLIAVISAGFSSMWIITILHSLKGIEFYTFFLSETHLFETGWNYLFWFGLLTPLFYLISIIFKDPSFLIFEKSELSINEQKDNRSLISILISIYSLIPLLGNLIFAPIGLLLSIINFIQAKNVKNFISSIIGLVGTIILLWWFFG